MMEKFNRTCEKAVRKGKECMKYNSEIHRRRTIRLKEYDYSQPGAYFVTICTYNRECLFGSMLDGEMIVNENGKIVDSKIKKSLQPDCDKAALEALKAVKWKPALKKGKPVKVWITVPVKFALK